jgi:hypothetical protein
VDLGILKMVGMTVGDLVDSGQGESRISTTVGEPSRDIVASRQGKSRTSTSVRVTAALSTTVGVTVDAESFFRFRSDFCSFAAMPSLKYFSRELAKLAVGSIAQQPCQLYTFDFHWDIHGEWSMGLFCCPFSVDLLGHLETTGEESDMEFSWLLASVELVSRCEVYSPRFLLQPAHLADQYPTTIGPSRQI